ncbi:hypothetical protein ACVFI8_12235 [Agarivorans sp. MS3-6]
MDASMDIPHSPSAVSKQYVWVRYLALATVAGLAIWVLVSASQLGLANVYSYALRSWHERWQQDYSSQLNQDTVQIADQVGLQMLEYRNSDPLYQTLMAKQVEWRNFYQLVIATGENKSQLQLENLDEAFVHYLQAIEQRPTWPNTYVDIASNRLKSGESADLWFGYLEQGLRIAPATRASLVGVVNLGISNWEQLNPDQQALVTRSLKTLVDTQSMKAELARDFGSEMVRLRVCYLLNFEGHPAQPNFCKSG